ncbi:amidohydrolase family protein [Pseudomonas aeruginosa]|nr:amidohydrolase family protein [Pseudomonas aeruginosa]
MAELYDGPIVDAHHHFWDPQANYHPGSRRTPRFRSATATTARSSAATCRRTTSATSAHTGWSRRSTWKPSGTRAIRSANTLRASPRRTPWRAPRGGGAGLAGRAGRRRGAGGAGGLRTGPQRPPQARRSATPATGRRAAQPDERRALASRLCRAARHGLHFDLQTPWWNLAEAACLARDFPDTLIVLNHAGLPSDRSEEGLAAWQRAMARFAECPNVALKISGIGQAGRRWSVEDNAWIVRESIALFGVERAMFASNFPVDSLCGSFDDIYGGFKRIVADLPYADQERLFHSNARRIYRTVPDTVRLQQASLDPRTSP